MPMSYDRFFDMLKERKIAKFYFRQNKVMGEKTLQAMREGKPVRTDIIARLCYLLECQPEDLMEYTSDESDAAGIPKPE